MISLSRQRKPGSKFTDRRTANAPRRYVFSHLKDGSVEITCHERAELNGAVGLHTCRG